MRKLLLLITVLLLALFLVACGSSDVDVTKVKVDEEFQIGDALITLQSVRIKNDRANLFARWNNQSAHEMHFSYISTLEVMQGGEMIEITNEEKMHRKTKSGVDGTLDLTFKPINDKEDITLIFHNNLDDDKKEIIIELE